MAPYAVQTAFMQAVEKEINAGEKGYCNFKEPGLGKTADAYNLFLNLNSLSFDHPYHVNRLIWLMPNFAKGTIGAMIDRDMGMFEPTCLSPNIPTDERIWEINYDITRFKLAEDISAFMKKYKCMFVADESHNCKNFKGKSSRAVQLLAKHAVFSMCSTGTPMGENVQDVWAQLRIAKRISGTNPIVFRNEHAIMGGYMGKQIVGIKDEDKFRTLMNKCAFIASADDWLDLPDRVYNIAKSEMLPAQTKLYTEMYRDRFLPLIDGRGDVSADMVITMLIKLQQIASGFIIDDDKLTSMLMPVDQNPRIQTVKEICANRPGKKIIFTTSRYSTQALADYLPNSIMVKGGMEPHEIQDAKDRFNANGGPDTFVAPEQLASEAITLLGGRDKRWNCSTTIYYENLYSLIKRKQSEDRNRRIGQRERVFYYDISMSRSDERILKALQTKNDVVKSVILREEHATG